MLLIFKLLVLFLRQVPIHLRTNWDSFYLEMLMLAGLGVYFLNFLAGKTKNNKLAQAWYNSHKQILENKFTLVGKHSLWFFSIPKAPRMRVFHPKNS